MSALKKSLRRKPPPPLNDSVESKDDISNIQDSADIYSSTSYPSPGYPTESYPVEDDSHLSFESTLKSPQLTPLIISVHRVYEDIGDTTYDELVLNYSNVRAKGPVDLPPEPFFSTETILPSEYSSFQRSPVDISPNSFLTPGTAPPSRRRRSFSSRKFQNLLQPGTLSVEVLELEQDPFAIGRLASSSPTGRNNVPYPVHDYSRYDESDASIDIDNYRDLKDYLTPTRIPTLEGSEPLHHTFIDIPKSGSPRSNNGELYFMRSSPPLFQTTLASSPDLLFRPTISSTFSSPTRSNTQGQSFDSMSYMADNRGSACTLPTKTFSNKLPDLSSENEHFDLYDDYGEERYPEWSLIEHDDTDYYDNQNFEDQSINFDFLALPELPSSPGHRKTSSALSSFISKQIPDPSPPIPQNVAKKYSELPPVPMDLPTICFTASSLTPSHFMECRNVWSISEISRWCIKLSTWIKDLIISQKEFEKVVTRLLVHHKPDDSVDVIERNVKHLINRLTESEFLISSYDEEKKAYQIQFDSSHLKSSTGVLVELCRCYCIDEQKLGKTRESCYSWLCPVNNRIAHEKYMSTVVADDIVLGTDWASHWSLSAQEISLDPKGSKKQSFVFDLIKFEQNFLNRANIFIEKAGPEFIKCASLLLGQNSPISMLKFRSEILDSASTLATLHKTSLLTPLKNILIADGKFIRNIKEMANLYYTWSKQAQKPLLQYMGLLPTVEDVLSREIMKGWDTAVSQDPRLKEQQVNGNMLLISTFNSRYQQLPLQLLDIRKFFEEDDEEYVALTKAIESIKALGSKINEMKVHADNVHLLKQVEKHLSWKITISQVNLKLSSSKRKFYYRGDLMRKGDLKINSSTVHIIVLDNYILITERQRSNKSSLFKVTELPIPVEFLLVELRDSDSLISKSMLPVNGTNNLSEPDDESSAFPFKIRFAGRGKSQTHTLIAKSDSERKKWISVLLQARHSAIKGKSRMAPFMVEATDNSFFAYDLSSRIPRLPLLATNDPISTITNNTKDRLNKRNVVGDLFSPNITKLQLLHHQITYTESFSYMNTRFVFVGLNTGIYCSDGLNIWKKIVNLPNVSKFSIIPELSVVLLLANKELRYYPLKSLIDTYYERKQRISSFLLTNGTILFYEYGRHREVPTLFVARKKSSGTTIFRVFALETDNHGILSTFSVIKRFYIQAECYGISIFNTSIAVHTNRGFEILDLDKLIPRTIPELPPSEGSTKKLDAYSRRKDGSGIDQIRKVLAHTTPMGMYKLRNNKEFILVYTDCAIFVNKNGKLSRKSMLYFDFKPRHCSFVDNYMILVCEEVIEIWSISDFTTGTNSLVQVLTCKDIHMTNISKLEFQSANPKVLGLQLLFRLVSLAKEN